MFRTARHILIAMAIPLGILSLVATADHLQAQQPAPKTPVHKLPATPPPPPSRPITIHPRGTPSVASSFTGVIVRPNNAIGFPNGAAAPQISSGYLGNNGGNFYNPMTSFNPTSSFGFNSSPMLYGFNAYMMNPYANPNNLFNPVPCANNLNPNIGFNGMNFNGMNFNGNVNGFNAFGVQGFNGFNNNINGFVPGATFVGNGPIINGNHKGVLGINGFNGL